MATQIVPKHAELTISGNFLDELCNTQTAAGLIDAAEADIGNDAIKGLHVLAELAALQVKAALKSGADEERERATGTLHYLDSLVVHVNETFHVHLLNGASTLLRVAMAQMAARASSALELQHG